MAYPIRKRRDGVYTFVFANLPPQAGISIEANLRLNEQVLRFLITTES
jgi:ribosomal protein S6